MSFSIYSARPLRPPAMPLSIADTANAHDRKSINTLENIDNGYDFEGFKDRTK